MAMAALPSSDPPSGENRLESHDGLFRFDLCQRNEFLKQQGAQMPGFRKTGTTISGAIFKVGGSQLDRHLRHLRSHVQGRMFGVLQGCRVSGIRQSSDDSAVAIAGALCALC